MGVILTSELGTDLDLNWTAWRELLGLACLRGWEPMGTVVIPTGLGSCERRTEPEGGYYSNDGQFVVEEDAANLAAALEIEALARDEKVGNPDVVPDEGDYTANEIREFAAFFRQGAFRIF